MAFALTSDSGVKLTEVEEQTDDQLMLAYARGERSAFDLLYARYRQPLYGYLYRQCSNEAQAGELFQETWLRVVASKARFERQGRFRSWIFTLAHNCLVDMYRKNARQQNQSLDEDIEGGMRPDEKADNREIRRQLDTSVKSLPLEQRQAFCLHEEHGFSVKEIAEIQGIAAEAAKSRLRYAYRKLRTALQEHHQ